MKHAFLSALALAGAAIAPLPAAADELQHAFDNVFGESARTPARLQQAVVVPVRRAPPTAFELQLNRMAEPSRGRIGVATLDLVSGAQTSVLGDQPFPMASTVKIAVVATFLEGVDQGRWSLDQRFPLMVPTASKPLSTVVAPVRAGAALSAQTLIELALERSDNRATDAILAVIGGPQAVNRWLRHTGNTGIHVDRDIATLVRDDGIVNPAAVVETRDAATPVAMTRLIAGLYRGQWLSPQSRQVLFDAMAQCKTGIRRMKAGIPEEALVGHKTGTLANTSSDVGVIRAPDGHLVAVAIYVTGQGTKFGRESRIATLARGIYANYAGPGFNTAPGVTPAPGFDPEDGDTELASAPAAGGMMVRRHH